LSSGRQRVGGFDWLMVHIIAREAENMISMNDQAAPATHARPPHPATEAVTPASVGATARQ